MTIRSCTGSAAVALAILAGCVCAVPAAESPARFLTLTPSPIYSALGVRGTAAIDDATALFSNPAGLGRAPFNQISASHTDLFSDSTFDTFAVGRTLGEHRGALALGVLYLKKGTIEGRNDNGDSTGGFSANDLAVNVGYGGRIAPRLALGSSVKMIQQRIDRYSASAVAVDLGAQLEASNHLSFGASLNNLGTQEKFISEKESLPLSTSLGVVVKLSGLDITAESTSLIDEGRTSFGLGVGGSIGNALSLRGGYSFAQDRPSTSSISSKEQFGSFAGFSAGLGFTMGRFQLNYALVPHEELSASHQFGLTVTY